MASLSSRHRPQLSGMAGVDVKSLRQRFKHEGAGASTRGMPGRDDWFMYGSSDTPTRSVTGEMTFSQKKVQSSSTPPAWNTRDRSGSRSRRNRRGKKAPLDMSVSSALAETLRQQTSQNDPHQLQSMIGRGGLQMPTTALPIRRPQAPEALPSPRRMMNLSTARTAGISRYASLQSFHLDEAYDTPPRPQGKNLAAGTEADMVAAETTVAGQNPDADQLRFIHTEEEEEEEEEDIEKHEEKCDGEDEEDYASGGKGGRVDAVDTHDYDTDDASNNNDYADGGKGGPARKVPSPNFSVSELAKLRNTMGRHAPMTKTNAIIHAEEEDNGYHTSDTDGSLSPSSEEGTLADSLPSASQTMSDIGHLKNGMGYHAAMAARADAILGQTEGLRDPTPSSSGARDAEEMFEPRQPEDRLLPKPLLSDMPIHLYKAKMPPKASHHRGPPPKRFTPERRRQRRRRVTPEKSLKFAASVSAHSPAIDSPQIDLPAPEFTPPPPMKSPRAPEPVRQPPPPPGQSPGMRNRGLPPAIVEGSKHSLKAASSVQSVLGQPERLKKALSSRLAQNHAAKSWQRQMHRVSPASSPTRTKAESFLSPRPDASSAVYSPLTSEGLHDAEEGPPSFTPPPPMTRPPSYLLGQPSMGQPSSPSFGAQDESDGDEAAFVIDTEDALFSPEEASADKSLRSTVRNEPTKKHRRSFAIEGVPIHKLGRRLLNRSLQTEIIVETGESIFQDLSAPRTKTSPPILHETVSFFSANDEPSVDKLRSRRAILDEMLASERSFVRYLRALVDVYFEPLIEASVQDGFITETAVDAIFGNVPVLLALNQRLLQKLEILLQPKMQIGTLTDQSMAVALIFIEHSALFRGYAFYASNHMNAFSTLLELRAKSKEFMHFYDEAKADPRCANQNLESLLIMPAQRIPRYEIFLKRLLKHTSPQHHDYEPLKRAVQLIADVNDDVESTMKIAENRNEVTNIEALFGNTVQLSSPSRRYILNTKVTFDDGRREHKCLMFLFNNLLLIGKTKGRHKFSAIAKHGFTPHTKADILRGNDIVIKDKGDDGRAKVICCLRGLSGKEAQNIQKQINTNVRHIRHRTRPSIQQRRSNQRRSIEFVHGVVSGQMGLHTAPGRSIKRGTHQESFW